jgi:SSS family solute:Na+ symporter
VDAYLTLISITDMPLCVIAVVYGLLWKRATWQGAVAGYLCGATAGAVLRFGFHYEVAEVTFASGGVAALVCLVASLLTTATPAEKIKLVFGAKMAGEAERISGEVYHILPVSAGGRFSLAILVLGFAIFLTGVLLGSQASNFASRVAVAGMIVYFFGGLLRTRFD